MDLVLKPLSGLVTLWEMAEMHLQNEALHGLLRGKYHLLRRALLSLLLIHQMGQIFLN